jgi:hypothetical protein
MPTVEITLNRAGVAAPVQLAAIASSDVIASGLTAFAADTLAKPTIPDQFPEVQIRGPEMTSGQPTLHVVAPDKMVKKAKRVRGRGVALLERPPGRGVGKCLFCGDQPFDCTQDATRPVLPASLSRACGAWTMPLMPA